MHVENKMSPYAGKPVTEELKQLSSEQVTGKELVGEKITAILTTAPGNKQPIGGLKVETKKGWFAARHSGTENIYKIYAESFLGKEHLESIISKHKLSLTMLWNKRRFKKNKYKT